jgi:hypothetical protein
MYTSFGFVYGKVVLAIKEKRKMDMGSGSV